MPSPKVELTIYIPEALRTRLRIDAARRGVTLSSVVEDAIRGVLYRPEPTRIIKLGRSERKRK